MKAGEITGPVRQLILDHIDSVAELELLLLLFQHPDREWAATDVAHDLRVEPEWTERRLAALAAQGLIVSMDGPPPRYQFKPATTDLDAAVTALAQAYAQRRVTIITLIYSKPRDHIRSFADAFRLREEK